MAWKTMPNGAHVDIDKGETPTEAFNKQAGTTTTESHQRANENLKNALNKNRQKAQERTHEVVSQMKMESVEIKGNRYITKKNKYGEDVEIDTMVLNEVNKILVGKEFETAHNGKVRLREEAPDLKGNEHIAKTAHELDVEDITKIPEALRNPTHFIPKGGTIDNDTYILSGKFGEAKDKNYLYVHVGNNNEICEIKTAYVNEKIRGKFKKVIEAFKKK